MDQAKDKVDLTEGMIEEVEMTAEVAAAVEIEEAVAAVETVAADKGEEDNLQNVQICKYAKMPL